jgi:hypothetical protein
MKILRVFLVGTTALFLIVVTLSVVEAPLTCYGVIVEADGSRPGDALLTVRSYRPWIAAWSESKGYVWIRLPAQLGTCHVYFRDNDDRLRISDSATRVEGAFSRSGRNLHLKTPAWSFDGTCGSARDVPKPLDGAAAADPG